MSQWMMNDEGYKVMVAPCKECASERSNAGRRIFERVINSDSTISFRLWGCGTANHHLSDLAVSDDFAPAKLPLR
jgi:hypothetical protein